MTDYRTEGASDARGFIEHYANEIVDALVDNDHVSTDLLNDYPDGDAYIHENYTDKAYSLLEAAELLDQLSQWEETDSGLWHGLAPRDALGAQAAYTYSAYVCSEIQDLIRALNDDCEAALDERDDSLDTAVSDMEAAKRAIVAAIVRKAAKGE